MKTGKSSNKLFKVAEERTEVVGLVKAGIFRTNKKAFEISGILGVHASLVSRILGGGGNIARPTRVRILQKWKELGLRPPEMRRIQEIWPDEARVAQQTVRLECPAILLFCLLLIAEEEGYFRHREIPDYLIQVAARGTGSDERLTGSKVLARVSDGSCHVGIAHDELLAQSATHTDLVPLIRIAPSVTASICVPEDVYKDVCSVVRKHSSRADKLPVFRDIVDYVSSHKDGGLWLDAATIAPACVEFIAEKANLPSLRTLAAKAHHLDYDDLVNGRWPDRCCLVVTWPPYAFLGCNPESSSERKFIELADYYYDICGDGPHLDRNVAEASDIYRILPTFSRSASVFTTPQFVNEHPAVASALHLGLQRSARLLHAKELAFVPALKKIAPKVWHELLNRPTGVDPPPTFVEYLERSLRRMSPSVESLFRVRDHSDHDSDNA